MVPLPPPFGSCAPPVPSLSGFGVGLPSWRRAPPTPRRKQRRSNEGPRKEGFPTPGRRPRIRRKVNPNAPPSFGWSSPPHSLCAVVLLSLLLLPTGLPSPSFLELGLPHPDPQEEKKRRRVTAARPKKKKDKSSTHKKVSGIRAPQEERERGNGSTKTQNVRGLGGKERGREGWPSVGLPLAFFSWSRGRPCFSFLLRFGVRLSS